MKPWPLAVAAGLLLLAALPAPSAASGLEVSVVGHLPGGLYRAASVQTGDSVYLLGGRDATNVTASVIRYDIRSGEASGAAFRLPQPRMSACAVCDRGVAYVFGGADGGLELDSILRVDTATGEVSTLGARLPSPRIGLAAALFGNSAYLFGGHSNGTKITAIGRFNLLTENLSLMGASLPSGRAGMGVAAARGGIFLFGGKTDPGASDEVLFFDPANDTLSVLPGRLPYTVYHLPAVPFGGKVLLIGGNAQQPGWNVSRATDTIIEFDPSTGSSSVLPLRLPSPRERASAVPVRSRVLVFGGQEGVSALDEIVAIGPPAGRDERGTALWVLALSAGMLVPVAAIALVARRRR